MVSLSNLKPLSKIALVRDTKLFLKPSLKLLLIILATHLGKNDFCFPSIDTLMKEMEIGGRRHIIKFLQELEDKNLIKKVSKDKRSNKYYINFELIYQIHNGMVPPWELVPMREPNQFPLDTNQFPLSTNQFPRGNSKALKLLNENKEEDFFIDAKIKAENARNHIRRLCNLKKDK